MDEKALNRVDRETAGYLWTAGALKIAFGQLYSREKMAFLDKLAELESSRDQPEMEFDEFDTLDIDWDKIKL